MTRRTYTDVQLSRILTAHAQGGLKRLGRTCVPAYPACMNQAAFASNLGATEGSTEDVRSGQCPPRDFVLHGGWFDQQYDPEWTVDELLRWLEEQGLA